MPNSRIPAFTVPLVDLKTGLVSRVWFDFFFLLYKEVLLVPVFDVLFNAKAAENSQTTQYTSPISPPVKTIIDKFTARNYSGGAVTISVNLVAVGGAAASSNLAVSYSLAAGETYYFPELVGQYLDPGDFISTLAGAATSVSIRACGRQVPT